MNRICFWSGVTCMVFLLLGGGHNGRINTGSASQVPRPASCSSLEYHQFDFWIGDWDVFDVDQPEVKSAHVRVDPILDGCVLHEQYEDPAGAKGESFSIYDVTRGVWHQTWVTNHGRLLTIEGTFKEGEMVLSGADRTMDGKERRVRGVWKAIPRGVRETAVTSLDGGKTWQPWFDLEFRAAPAPQGTNGLPLRRSSTEQFSDARNRRFLAATDTFVPQAFVVTLTLFKALPLMAGAVSLHQVTPVTVKPLPSRF